MQLKSFGVLLVDFIENEKRVSVENTFKELCELKKPRRVGGISIGGGGSIQITNYGKVTEVVIPPEFERVELSLVQESRFITDIYCYGILKKESIGKAESNPQEVRSLIDRTQSNLEKFIKPYINGMFSKNELEDGWGSLPIRILHIDPEITNPFRLKIIDNREVRDDESINQWIRDNHLFLNVLGFNNSALMSKDNLSLTSRSSVWGDYRSGFVVVSFHGGTGEEYPHPVHFTSVADIVKMLRIFYWSNLRSKQIALNRVAMEGFYQRLKNIKKGKSIAEVPKKLDEVNTEYSDVLEWQVNLLSLHARMKDEIEHFKINLYNLNVAYDFEKRLSTMETDSEGDGVLFRREEESDWKLLPSIYEHVKINVSDLDSKLSIIDERQRSLVRYTHDFVNTLVAMGNVNLQKEIRNLTRWTVLIAVIALLIAIFSNVDKILQWIK